MNHSHLKITDLDFCETQLLNQQQVKGQGNLNGVAWDGFFDFDWAHNRRNGFAIGNITGFALAIGPVTLFQSPF
ncbi:hypothetical protein PCC7424_3512 [Gloeothece citriformis PCC 7424]|uniref:Uncharacterized protein n=1 Tax=Gloeothece citriformis (strain PCC 7424) TaxID=65393 RepID=B7KGH7_GLOC7|nr:hypothetical protein [Gloeothece citriformis]ACK71904.1 hypothetical protein PCC7424_3512 [Gloeothece citriformis PCC 7424]